MSPSPWNRRLHRCILFVLLFGLLIPTLRTPPDVQAVVLPPSASNHSVPALPARADIPRNWTPAGATNTITSTLSTESVSSTLVVETNPQAIAAARMTLPGSGQWLDRYGTNQASSFASGETSTAPSFALNWIAAPQNGAISANPIVVGNTIFMFYHATPPYDFAQTVVAFTLDTGTKLWERPIWGKPIDHVLADSTRLYFVYDSGYDLSLRAINQSNGHDVWETYLGVPLLPHHQDAVYSRIFKLANNKVFVSFPSHTNNFFILDATSGASQANFSVGDPTKQLLFLEDALIKDNALYIAYVEHNTTTSPDIIPSQGFVKMYSLSGSYIKTTYEGDTTQPESFMPLGSSLLIGNPTTSLFYFLVRIGDHSPIVNGINFTERLIAVNSQSGTVATDRTFVNQSKNANLVSDGASLYWQTITCPELQQCQPPVAIERLNATSLATEGTILLPEYPSFYYDHQLSLSNGYLYITSSKLGLPGVIAIHLATNSRWYGRSGQSAIGNFQPAPAIAINNRLVVTDKSMLMVYAPGVERPYGHDLQDCPCTKSDTHQGTTTNGTGSVVNTNNGAYGYGMQGVSLPSPDGTLNGNLAYGSSSAPVDAQRAAKGLTSNGPFGLAPGWTHSYNRWLDLTSTPNTILYHGPLGAQTHFTYDGLLTPGMTFNHNPEVFATLTYETPSNPLYPSPAYVLRTLEQETWYFNSKGQLRMIRTATGGHQRLVYSDLSSSSWQLTRVESVQDSTKALTFNYTDGLLATIRDSATRGITLTYSSATGDLSAVYSVINQPEYFDYTNHLLTERRDSLNRVLERTTFQTIESGSSTALPFGTLAPRVITQQSRFQLVNGTPVADVTTTHDYRLLDRTMTVTDRSQKILLTRSDRYSLNNTLTNQRLNGQVQRQLSVGANLVPTERRDALGRITKQTTNAMGQPTRMTNALQQTQAITYTPQFRPERSHNYQKHQSAVTYDSHGNVTHQTTAITTMLPLGRTTIYTYNVRYPGKNWLEASLSVDKLLTEYSYNANGQITQQVGSKGTSFETTTTYTYDALGRQTTVTTGVGTPAALTITSSYNPDNTLARTVTNPVANPSPTDRTANLVTEHGYDAAGRRIWTKGPDGRYREYVAYDQMGNVRWTVTNPINAQGQSALPSSTTTPPVFTPAFPDANIVKLYGYDTLGRTTLVTETGILTGTFALATRQWSAATTRTTRTEYDALSRPVTVTLNYRPTINGGQFTASYPDVNVPTYTYYDAVGNPIWQKDAFHRWTKTEYDVLNRPMTVTLNYENGNPATIDLGNRSWATLNDTDVIHLTRYNQFGVAETINNYDPRSTGTWSATEPITNRVTRYTYNTLGMVVGSTSNYAPGVTGRTDVNLTSATVVDPTTERVLATQDTSGQWNRPVYDALGRVVQTIQNCRQGNTPVATACGAPSGSISGTIDRNVASAVTEYDAIGRPYQTITPNAITTRTQYDVLGRSTQIIANYRAIPSGTDPLPINVTETTTYLDRAGRVWSATDATNKTTTYAANALGQTVAITDSAGLVTQYGYDATGTQRWVRLPSGRVDVTLVDGLGRTMHQIRNYQDGVVTSADGTTADLITRYRYDGMGNLRAQTDPLNRTTSYQYDLFDRLIAVIEADTPTCTAGSADCRLLTSYRYDRAGNQTAITNARGFTRTMAYDAQNRLISETDATQRTITYAYTVRGQETTQTGWSTPQGQPIVRSTYDELGRRMTLSGAPTLTGSATATQRWTYDSLGRITTFYDSAAEESATQRTGIKTYSYDALNRIINEQRSIVGDPAGASVAMAFTYDAAGRVTTANGVTYGYDSAGRPASVQANPTMLATYGYDSAGRLGTMTRQTNSTTRATTTYGYDALDRITSIQTVGATGTAATPTATLSTYGYTYDRASQLLTTTTLERISPNITFRINTMYSYDGVGRLTTEQRKSGFSTTVYTYGYDRVGNRTGKTSQSINFDTTETEVESVFYDNANRISKVGSTGIDWGYDGFGNLLQGNGQDLAYDGLNRLISVAAGNGTVSYRYHGETPVLRSLSGGTTTALLHNTVTGAYSTLLKATELTATPTTTAYTYDTDGQVVARAATTASTTSHQWLLSDVQGSVRQRLDATTATLVSQETTAWGVPVTSAPDPIGYRGEYTDPTTGLIFLRARWYLPAHGRFISRDPFAGYAESPYSQHPYQYAYSNPLTNADPSGRQCGNNAGECFAQMPPDLVAEWQGFIAERNMRNPGELWEGNLKYLGQFDVAEARQYAWSWERYMHDPFPHYYANDMVYSEARVYWEYFLGVRYEYFVTYTQTEEIEEADRRGLPVSQAARDNAGLWDAAMTGMLCFGLNRLQPGGVPPIKTAPSHKNVPVESTDGVKPPPTTSRPSTPRTPRNPVEGCSFTADTMVATVTGLVPIARIREGDKVLAFNEETQTTGLYTVTTTMVHDDPVVLDLIIDDEYITTTPEHPFAVRDQGWIAAIFLKEGDIIQSSNGAWGTVLGTQVRHTPQPMYNLTVAEAHTYFVGEGQWLVHNECGNTENEFEILYRVVSPAEFANLEATGKFTIGPRSTYEDGKWFALTSSGASRFKDLFSKWDGDSNVIVQARVPRDVYNSSRLDRNVDGIGGIYIQDEKLPFLEYIR